MNPTGVFPRGNGIVWGLSNRVGGYLATPATTKLGGVDDRKALGIVAALEIKRLVLCGVDMRHLPRV